MQRSKDVINFKNSPLKQEDRETLRNPHREHRALAQRLSDIPPLQLPSCTLPLALRWGKAKPGNPAN